MCKEEEGGLCYKASSTNPGSCYWALLNLTTAIRMSDHTELVINLIHQPRVSWWGREHTHMLGMAFEAQHKAHTQTSTTKVKHIIQTKSHRFTAVRYVSALRLFNITAKIIQEKHMEWVLREIPALKISHLEVLTAAWHKTLFQTAFISHIRVQMKAIWDITMN